MKNTLYKENILIIITHTFCIIIQHFIFCLEKQDVITNISLVILSCSGGGIGRRAALRSLWENYPVGVRVPSWANIYYTIFTDSWKFNENKENNK